MALVLTLSLSVYRMIDQAGSAPLSQQHLATPAKSKTYQSTTSTPSSISSFCAMGIDDDPRRLNFQALVEYYTDRLIGAKADPINCTYATHTALADILGICQPDQLSADDSR